MKVRAVTAATAAAVVIIKAEYGSCVSIKATYLSLDSDTQTNTSFHSRSLGKVSFSWNGSDELWHKLQSIGD